MRQKRNGNVVTLELESYAHVLKYLHWCIDLQQYAVAKADEGKYHVSYPLDELGRMAFSHVGEEFEDV